MGLVSSLLGADKDRESKVHEETIERWRRRQGGGADANQEIVDGEESVQLLTSKQLELTPTIDLNQEVIEVSESWQVGNESGGNDWQVDTAYLDSKRELFDEEKTSRWIPRALSGKAAPVAKTPAEPAVVEEFVRVIPNANVKPLTTPVSKAVESAVVAEPERNIPGRAQPSEPSLTVEEDLKRRFGTNIRSALGPGTVIEGKMTFDSPVRIDGTINGEVTSTSTLIVGEQAVVSADLRVATLVVLGQVKGNVHATDLVEIRRGGQIEGDLESERLVVELGGFFEGVNTPLRLSTPAS